MLNFFNKTTPLVVASIIAVTTAFAQDNTTNRSKNKCFDQGLEMPMGQTMAAHSHHARTEVRGSWDIWAKGSYLYWQARQENMDIGMYSNAAAPTGTYAAGTVFTVQHPQFEYKSGFNVELGVNLDYDYWEAFAEYTWFHGTTNSTVSVTAPSAGSTILPMQGVVDDEVYDRYYYSANQSWDLKMDFADISLGRSYYSGSNLIMVPFFGARGAWIRQNLYTAYDGSALDTNGLGQGALTVENKTISQGIGPRAGVNSKYQCGYGFRLEGDASFDILYTRYNYRMNQSLTNLAGAPVSGPFTVQEKHEDFLRAHAGLELGFGWGSYFDNNNWFIDLSATYGFQVFWDQNMFRTFNGYGVAYSNTPSGNLYVHGLTANLKLDF